MYTKIIKGKEYYYDKSQESAFIDSTLKKRFDEFCKEKKIKKNKLIEDFYKAVLLNYRDGSLEATKGFVTVNILNNISHKNGRYFLEKKYGR